MIEATRVLTDRPFNVNVFCHRTPAPDPAADDLRNLSLTQHDAHLTIPVRTHQPCAVGSETFHQRGIRPSMLIAMRRLHHRQRGPHSRQQVLARSGIGRL